MGTLSPNSTFVIAQELEKNHVEVIKESLDNYKQAGLLTDLAGKNLGAFK